jgi:ATP-dependent Lhr-like helicase
VAGGFAATYGVLKALEDAGRVRRGYFVDGHGGAQFALSGADERLRQPPPPKSQRAAIVLAATDPANAWGALLDWPPTAADARPQRAAGALVVLLGGSLIGWMGRGEHPLLTFLPEGTAAATPSHHAATDGGAPDRSEVVRALAHSLGGIVESPSRRALLVSSIDGLPAADSPLASFFVEAGFVRTARGLLKRKSQAGQALDAQPAPEASVAGARRS